MTYIRDNLDLLVDNSSLRRMRKLIDIGLNLESDYGDVFCFHLGNESDAKSIYISSQALARHFQSIIDEEVLA